MTRTVVSVRLSSAERAVFDSLPGATQADKFRYLLQTRTVNEALAEIFRHEIKTVTAQVSALQEKVDVLSTEIRDVLREQPRKGLRDHLSDKFVIPHGVLKAAFDKLMREKKSKNDDDVWGDLV